MPVLKEIMELHMQRMEDSVSEEFLKHFCETEDLSSVNHLEIMVDSTEQSLEDIGHVLPNLLQLKLTGSTLSSVRALGTSLNRLQVLWLGQCGLQFIEGVATMQCLRELYLPFNDVRDLAPLTAHDSLQVLDIEGNAIEDVDEVQCLWMCSQLKELTLHGNPMCKLPTFSRGRVLEMLPQLEVLDDMDVGPHSAQSKLSPQMADVPYDLTFDENIEMADLEADVLLLGSNSNYKEEPASPRSSVEFGSSSFSMCSATGGVEPLQATHHLLSAGLRDAASKPDDRLFAGEPNEDELILERLKQLRQRRTTQLHASTLTARSALQNTWFSYQPTARVADLPRPSSASSLRPRSPPDAVPFRMTTSAILEGFVGSLDPEASASQLTRGAQLAGNPLIVARLKRQQAPAASQHEDGLGIRALLLRHHGDEGLGGRCPQAGLLRPGTPDVRVHRFPTAGELCTPLGTGGTVEERLRALMQSRAVPTARRPAHEAQAPCAPSAPKKEGQGRPPRRVEGGRSPVGSRSPKMGAPAAKSPKAGATSPSAKGASMAPSTVSQRPVVFAPPPLSQPFPRRRSHSTSAATVRQPLGAASRFAGDLRLETNAVLRGGPGSGYHMSLDLDGQGITLVNSVTFKGAPDLCANATRHADALFFRREADLGHCLIAC